MNKVRFFNQIGVKIPIEKIYARLGYQPGVTKISSEQEKELKAYIEEAVQLIQLKGAARRIAIEMKHVSKLELSEGVIFEGNLVGSVFEDCQELLLIGATAGAEIVKAITNVKDNDLTRGVVFDAVASETVDASFVWIQDYFGPQLKRENKQLIPKRISCGYGDFALTNQETIHRLLQLEKIQVSITDRYVLIPEKSVTAICGVIQRL
ncbi:MAG: hypothetical protein K9L86_07140 [Candidatus Omnitrophica bacterium]|nr:hypothetical protein [Candidatus Omnitrophota bacterium]